MIQGESGEQVAVDTSEAYVEEGSAPEHPAEAAPDAAPEPVKDTEDSPDDDGSETGKKHRRGGFKKKIERLAAEKAALEAENARLKALAESKPAPQAERPKPEDYQDHDAYVEALTDWKVEHKVDDKLKQRDNDAKQAQLRAEMMTRQEAFSQREDKFREQQPDYEDAMENYDGPMTVQLQQSLIDSEYGPEIFYHLAKNPQEAERITKLSILDMAKAVGKLEASIEGKKSVKAAVKTTQAPPPIAPVKTSAKTSKVTLEEADYDEYRRLRGYS